MLTKIQENKKASCAIKTRFLASLIHRKESDALHWSTKWNELQTKLNLNEKKKQSLHHSARQGKIRISRKEACHISRQEAASQKVCDLPKNIYFHANPKMSFFLTTEVNALQRKKPLKPPFFLHAMDLLSLPHDCSRSYLNGVFCRHCTGRRRPHVILDGKEYKKYH
jgi:hypothetical protein